ncbi:MAG: helix-turn-helix domain-containing protein [Kiritimatiellia bacterium]
MTKKKTTNKQKQVAKNEEAIRVGQAIRRIRLERKMKQAELAALVQMQPAQLCNSEKGNNLPSLRTLGRICKVLGVTVNDLLYPASELAAQGAEVGAEAIGASMIGGTQTSAERLCEPLGAQGILRCTHVPEVEAVMDDNVVAMLLERFLDYRALEIMCGVNSCATLPLNLSFDIDANGAGLLASLVRMHLGIGSAVAVDYVEVLENNGLRVIFSRLPETVESLSFADSKNNTVFIVVSDALDDESQIFRILFELANIYLYVRSGCSIVYDTDATRQFATRFATFMLLPQVAVQTSVSRMGIEPEQWNLEALQRMKARFGVSTETFLRRLNQLDLLPRDGELFKSLLEAVGRQSQKKGAKDAAGTIRCLSRNARFDNLLFCAKLNPENAKEVRKIEARVRKNYPYEKAAVKTAKAPAKDAEAKPRRGPGRPPKRK